MDNQKYSDESIASFAKEVGKNYANELFALFSNKVNKSYADTMRNYLLSIKERRYSYIVQFNDGKMDIGIISITYSEDEFEEYSTFDMDGELHSRVMVKILNFYKDKSLTDNIPVEITIKLLKESYLDSNCNISPIISIDRGCNL